MTNTRSPKQRDLVDLLLSSEGAAMARVYRQIIRTSAVALVSAILTAALTGVAVFGPTLADHAGATLALALLLSFVLFLLSGALCVATLVRLSLYNRLQLSDKTQDVREAEEESEHARRLLRDGLAAWNSGDNVQHWKSRHSAQLAQVGLNDMQPA